MSYQPTWKERFEDAKIYLGPAIAGCILLGVSGWVVWHQFGRKEKSGKVASEVTVEAGAQASPFKAAREAAEAAEKAYRLALEAGAAQSELEKLLDDAVLHQRRAVRLEPELTIERATRLARLEEARRTLGLESAFNQSMRLEEQARADRKAGKETEALVKLREAWRLQRLANTSGPLETQNPLREVRLASELAEADVAPLRAAVEASRTRARTALAREEWAEAEKALRQARTEQQNLNRLFPESRFSNTLALDQFDAEVAAIAPQRLAAQSAARARAAEAAAAAGRIEEADKGFTEAVALQRELNDKYQQSRLASPTRIDDLNGRRDAALAAGSFARVKEFAAEASRLLRERKVAEAVEKVGAGTALLEQTMQAFPRARLPDPAVRTQIELLNLKKADLLPIQQQVHARLVRFGPAGMMLDVEVSQELYQRVMNANPSRSPGRLLPVESVTWAETQEFCQRLSWILGMRVRLPTEVDFRVALGNGVSAMWSANSSEGRSQEIGKSAANVAGFFDLLGNVAEWVQPVSDPGSDRGVVMGGSYVDPVDTLRRVPVAVVEKRDRLRHVGFRFVAE